MEWSNLRLESDVMNALDVYRLRLEYNVRKYPARYPLWLRGSRVSLGNAVRFLIHDRNLKYDRAHRHRVKAYLETLPTVGSESSGCEEGNAHNRPTNGESATDVASDADSGTVALQQGS